MGLSSLPIIDSSIADQSTTLSSQKRKTSTAAAAAELSLANNNSKLDKTAKVNKTNLKMSINRNRVINKLALVLISIIVLELVLIGDQVQPVKAIKKKIYLKKLKKLLPLFALVKPKKKIILLPIPIPMFKSHSSNHHHQNTQHYASRPQPLPAATTNYSPMQTAPMSFVMMDTNRPPQPSFMSLPMDPSSSMIASMTMSNSNDPIESIITEPTTTTVASNSLGNISSASENLMSSAMSLNGPTMTMTIQSKPDGGSNIELSTNINGAPSGESGALLQQRPSGSAKWARPHSPAKLIKQQQQQQQQVNLAGGDHNFDDPSGEQQPGGEQYYSSPWTNRSPLVSPAKVLRQPLIPRQQQQPTSQLVQNKPHTAQKQLPVPLQQNQWRPFMNERPLNRYQNQQQLLQMIDQQQLNQALESEELMPVGPPQEMPVYHAPNGQLHISLPTHHQMRQSNRVNGHLEQEQEPLRPAVQNQENQGEDEVQTLMQQQQPGGHQNQQQHEQSRVNHQLNNQKLKLQNSKPSSKGSPVQSSSRLVSPAVKGKQQQLNQTNKQQSGKQAVSAGGY